MQLVRCIYVPSPHWTGYAYTPLDGGRWTYYEGCNYMAAEEMVHSCGVHTTSVTPQGQQNRSPRHYKDPLAVAPITAFAQSKQAHDSLCALRSVQGLVAS